VGKEEHEGQAKKGQGPVPYAVIAVSDSRTTATDESGPLVAHLLDEAGHAMLGRVLIRNDLAAIQAEVHRWVADGARLLVLAGGTGAGQRDITVEAVRPLLEKELEGFGELFRALSFQEIGATAMLSRALLGLRQGRAIVCLPGSPGAIRLALTKLLIPELAHLLWAAGR
jgi:molybdenum cofactor biosynthesis protein B